MWETSMASCHWVWIGQLMQSIQGAFGDVTLESSNTYTLHLPIFAPGLSDKRPFPLSGR